MFVLPVVFPGMSLGDFQPKPFSKYHEGIHGSLGELMRAVSFHRTGRTVRLGKKLGPAVAVLFLILPKEKFKKEREISSQMVKISRYYSAKNCAI